MLSRVGSLSSANLTDIEFVVTTFRVFVLTHAIAGLAIAYVVLATASIWRVKGNIWYLSAHLTSDLLLTMAFTSFTVLIFRHFPSSDHSGLLHVTSIMTT